MSYEAFQGHAWGIQVKDKELLGLGSYDGRHIASTLERGPRSITVVDSGQYRLYDWGEPEHYPGVTYIESDLMEYHTPADIVECNNVAYHVKSPWALFEHLRALTRECLILTTSFVPGEEPTWRICDPHEPRHIFWKPALPGLFLLLKETGFPQWEEVGRSGDHIVLRCKPG